MLKAIAAGSALLCATLAWFIIGLALTYADPPVMRPETVGIIAGFMSIGGCGLLVISPVIGLFNWARQRRA
jgi:hypothetical protein